MIYEYKGTEYEFPDSMSDERALQLIRADQGETSSSPSAHQQPSPAPRQRAEPIWDRQTGIPKPKNVIPYYSQGAQNITQKPYETLFPSASQVQGTGIGAGVKRNVMGALDVLGWPDRAIDYASGGAFQTGKETIGQMIEKLPGKGGLSRFGKDLLQAGKEIATSPTSYVGIGAVKKALTKDTPETIAQMMRKNTGLDKAIDIGVDKGIKPTVKNKGNFSKMSSFNRKANEAVRAIAENGEFIDLTDEFGEKIARPRNITEMAQAIEKTKKHIYNQYHEMAVSAGNKGSMFDSAPIVKKLEKLTDPNGFYKGNKSARSYAEGLIDDIKELDGAAPEVVEERIRELNESLAGFYDGRVAKVNARIDGSLASSMRKQLDDQIENAVGEGYQDLKYKYGSLRAIEKEVNHRAIVNARRAKKNVIDMTDIFTGGDLISGVISGNPALIARGVAGRSIKEIYRALNNPDRYIDKMFKKAYAEYGKAPKGSIAGELENTLYKGYIPMIMLHNWHSKEQGGK